jgi:hypothetical protein
VHRDVDAVIGLFGGGGSSGALLRAGGAVLTTLLVVPAILKLFVVTVDEGSSAIRTRNGKPIIRRSARRGRSGDVVVLRPGTHGAFPVFYWYRMVDMRARSTDLPPRQLTAASGHQHLVHASFDWRPLSTGHDLRVFELDVVDVRERAGNIVGAALRDTVHLLEGAVLPPNQTMSPLVMSACAEYVRRACGIELISVTVTGDALTDGYLLSGAMSQAGRTASDDWMLGAPALLATRLAPTG